MECPNCGEHIGKFELSLNCKKCGVNLYYSEQEKLLSEDAKRCELEFASFRIFSAKLKTAFIGGAPQIARLVFVFVCIGFIFIPFGSISAQMPFYSTSLTMSGYGIYAAFSDGNLMGLLDFLNIGVTHDIALKSLLLLGAIASLLIVDVAIFVTEILGIFNIRRSAKAMRIICVIGFVFSLVSIVFSLLIKNVGNGLTTISVTGSVGAGGFAEALAFIGMFIINHVIVKRNIQPIYKEVDLLRVETNKKVKKGLISLDDLPLPVFESEEEKQERLKLEKEEALLEEKERQNEAAGGVKHG